VYDAQALVARTVRVTIPVPFDVNVMLSPDMFPPDDDVIVPPLICQVCVMPGCARTDAEPEELWQMDAGAVMAEAAGTGHSDVPPPKVILLGLGMPLAVSYESMALGFERCVTDATIPDG
jgi:hypothetical protein